MPRLQIALGPILFNWSVVRVGRFYEAVAASPAIDRVYVGEVVCAKRHPLHADALDAAAERLRLAGKEVVRSSLALPASPSERRILREQVETPGLLELNDMSGLYARPPGAAFVAGPLLNIYNEDAARELMNLGCERLCANVELPLASVAAIGRACPGLELELFAFGRLPLALSGRCYHARLHGRRKDTCQFVCDRSPDGMPVATLEGQRFLAVNGVQAMSHDVQLAAVPPVVLSEAGITALRLSPHTCDMAAVAQAFRDFCDGRTGRTALKTALHGAGAPGPFVDGYLHGRAGRSGPS